MLAAVKVVNAVRARRSERHVSSSADVPSTLPGGSGDNACPREQGTETYAELLSARAGVDRTADLYRAKADSTMAMANVAPAARADAELLAAAATARRFAEQLHSAAEKIRVMARIAPTAIAPECLIDDLDSADLDRLAKAFPILFGPITSSVFAKWLEAGEVKAALARRATGNGGSTAQRAKARHSLFTNI